MLKIGIILLLPVFLLFGCKKGMNEQQAFLQADYDGKVTKIEFLGTYSQAETAFLLQVGDIAGKVETTSGFSLYRYSYKTINHNHNSIVVSGLAAVPLKGDIKGLVCWLHGTNANRNWVPSTPSPLQGIDVAAGFAGNGYVVIAPDYIGLGVSNEIPPYFHKKSTVNAVVDFISVGETILENLSASARKHLFIVGFSQGGSAALAVQEHLQNHNPTGFMLKATAAICGAYDLRNISIPYALENNSTFYMGYLANSFSNIYGQQLGSIIRPDYVSIIPQLFDGSKTYDEIESRLPATAAELYTDEMIRDIRQRNSNWFTEALEENQTYRWTPQTPLRLYYGALDKDVSPEDATHCYQFMKSAGGNVEILNAGNKDHFQALVTAFPDVQSWFNSIR